MSESLFIIAGESSGELYGAMLAEQLKALCPSLRLYGIGGHRMVEAGVEPLAPMTSALGLTEALSALRAVKASLDATLMALEKLRPRAVVLIDYPEFNFRVGKRARQLGIKVIYYSCPQIWAWRPWRIKEMAGFIDRAALIMPFEPEIYQKAGIPCEFVGHPVSEDMGGFTSDKSEAKAALGLDPDKKYVALLPGSRKSELKRLLPVMTGLVLLMKERMPEYGIVLSLAPNLKAGEFKPALDRLEAYGVHITRENITHLYTAAEAAVVASGTAAFQSVFRETPTVVIYKISRITEIILKPLVCTKYVNLANIILGRMALPELIQKKAEPEFIIEEVEALAKEGQRRAEAVAALHKVRLLFEGKRPSKRVAEMVAELYVERAA